MKKGILYFIEIIILLVIALTMIIFLDKKIKEEEKRNFEVVSSICEDQNLKVVEKFTKTGDKYYACK